MTVNFRGLPKYQDRLYYSDLNWQSPESIRSAYQSLADMEVKVDEEAVEWLSRWRELDTLTDNEGSIRYIEMTLATDDKERAEAFQYFTGEVQPILAEMSQVLREKLLNTPILKTRLRKEAPLLLRKMESAASIFRQENIPLQTELRNLQQEYQSISGAMTAEWNGETVTLQSLYKELEGTDRSIREKAYRAASDRRLQDKAKLDQVFDKMYELRNQVAKNAHFENFRDYMFEAKNRFDYTPAECVEFHEATQEYMVPIHKTLAEERKKCLALDTVRPWDGQIDLFGEKPVSPFSDTKDLVEKVGTVFESFDSELAGFYKQMRTHGLFDLDNRKGKAPGGYQALLQESKLPFIFMNAVGVRRDVMTLLHESGHAFHSFLSQEIDSFQMHAPMEFCEVASMSMELMTNEKVREVFGKEASTQLHRGNVLGLPGTFTSVCMVDSFQHWVYTAPEGADSEARHAKWLELTKLYSPGVDFSGLEDKVGPSWHRVLHIFEVPFYYIEYGIAQCGALMFWQKFEEDPALAISDYKAAMSAGGTLGLKDLFRRANMDWPMTKPAIAKLASFLESKINGLIR